MSARSSFNACPIWVPDGASPVRVSPWKQSAATASLPKARPSRNADSIFCQTMIACNRGSRLKNDVDLHEGRIVSSIG